jgi:hypothetical protein
MITIQNEALIHTILCQRYLIQFKYCDLNIQNNELGIALIKEETDSLSLDDTLTCPSLSMSLILSSHDDPKDIEVGSTLNIIKPLIDFAIVFNEKLCSIFTLFCNTTLEKIRYADRSDLQLSEYVKRWDAYAESIQHLDSKLAWFNGLYNDMFDQLYEFKFHPIRPKWSVARMMVVIWRQAVLEPLVKEDKLHVYLVKLIHNHTLKYVNTLISHGVKDTTVFPPSKLKKLFNSLIVDTSCNEKNILFLGDTKKFYPDHCLIEVESIVIDNLKVFLTGCINDKQELSTGYDICMRYIEQITGVYPVALEKRIYTEILVHLERFIRNKLKYICQEKFTQLCALPHQDICELIVAEDYLKQNDSLTLGNLIKTYVEEFTINLEPVIPIPHSKEYLIKGILYFLRSTFNEENEKWSLVVNWITRSQQSNHQKVSSKPCMSSN